MEKNTQLSKIVNTWTFDRLTPNGNEGVGVQINYLGHVHMGPDTMSSTR